jgi:hypothetical protein
MAHPFLQTQILMEKGAQKMRQNSLKNIDKNLLWFLCIVYPMGITIRGGSITA